MAKARAAHRRTRRLGTWKNPRIVAPAQAGAQSNQALDTRFRGYDGFFKARRYR
jgi:hypothetical protein